jgi:hypothetical protein
MVVLGLEDVGLLRELHSKEEPSAGGRSVGNSGRW